VFIHKSSDSLDLLTEARLERRFRAATCNLSRLYAGYYVAELLQELTDYGDPHPELYGLADRTLIELDRDCDPVWVILQFEVSALRHLGYLPSLDACVVCGARIAPEGRVLFGQLAGGVLCPKCRGGQKQVVSLSRAGLEVLQSLAGRHGGEAAPVAGRGVKGELCGLLNHYLVNLLGRPPRMQKYLGFLTT
jgi:DNA repair protein RecO (recombination protein O)